MNEYAEQMDIEFVNASEMPEQDGLRSRQPGTIRLHVRKLFPDLIDRPGMAIIEPSSHACGPPNLAPDMCRSAAIWRTEAKDRGYRLKIIHELDTNRMWIIIAGSYESRRRLKRSKNRATIQRER